MWFQLSSLSCQNSKPPTLKSRRCHQKRWPGCRYSRHKQQCDPSSRLLSPGSNLTLPRNSNDIPCSHITLLTHPKHLMSILLWSRYEPQLPINIHLLWQQTKRPENTYIILRGNLHTEIFFFFLKIRWKTFWGQKHVKRGVRKREQSWIIPEAWRRFKPWPQWQIKQWTTCLCTVLAKTHSWGRHDSENKEQDTQPPLRRIHPRRADKWPTC